MDEVNKYAPDDVIRLLIANKSDNDQIRAVYDDEGIDMSEYYGVKFLETSAKSSKNVL